MATAVPVVAIDGPSGSGKGTVSRALAERLGWHFLDSGALYRLVALAARQRGVDLDDEDRLAEVARALDVEFEVEPDGERVWLDGGDVTAEIRTEKAGDSASQPSNAVATAGGAPGALIRIAVIEPPNVPAQ